MGDARVPSVRLGNIQADKLSSYQQATVDDITVYCHESLPVLFRRITIKLEKILFFKRLAATTEW
ncbi:hypothetical protein [Sporomusa sphaeroides]|uniref:hypothetical protein n=1 Tax=Sporomusa sphaeroides TaxID=47679 RepID=UPI002BEB2CAC|nr:hypothetical protein [Sporomusa sphaeroides]HML35160.1 hypothetical protein [Sporomusa sphaeroides]